MPATAPPSASALSGKTFCFVDVETTGGSPFTHEVIEIAIVRVRGTEVIDRWSSLVRPRGRVPSMITGITGITQSMVDGAPRFADVADVVEEKLRGNVFVAQSARFDYGFLKNEFRRLDRDWRAKTLCTVRLSRALSPRHRTHGLDSIIERHGLSCAARHRALGDAETIAEFWLKAGKERGWDALYAIAKSLLLVPAAPSGLAPKAIAAVPRGTGVYVFKDGKGSPLYVGKSVDVRSRVLSHFSDDHVLPKDARIARLVRDVEHRSTVGELGALLLEARLIKEHLPPFNEQLRRLTPQSAIFLRRHPQGHTVEIIRGNQLRPEHFDDTYGMFGGVKSARAFLEGHVDRYGLCPKIAGLEKGPAGRACFSFHLGRCKGACGGDGESREAHDARLLASLEALRHRTWPFKGPICVEEADTATGARAYHLIDQWCYGGTFDDETSLRSAIAASRETERHFDVDYYRIVSSFLKRLRKAPAKSGVEVKVVSYA